MEGIITLFRRFITAPEQLNSAGEFAAAFGLLLVVALLFAVPVAILSRMLLERERLGTATRLRLAVGWTAIIFGLAALINAIVLRALDRVPHWTAVVPHCSLALMAGIVALMLHRAVDHELKAMRNHVDTAKREAA
jgi:hypothetical protein